MTSYYTEGDFMAFEACSKRVQGIRDEGLRAFMQKAQMMIQKLNGQETQESMK